MWCYRILRQSSLGEAQRRMFYLTQNASRVTFIWPVKMAAISERLDTWSQSAHEAASRAMQERIRLVANRSLGAYETLVTENSPVGFRAQVARPDVSGIDTDCFPRR